ncbi:hypothetical protein [Cellulomonas sp. JZ18]|uniref:hypothetical protein n=1 Tax=Cellulomonas sp. JZ18 TaxID=2654191 RepID=UPI001E3DA88B|nr:hypothetical protein [Cellulomonas sp. JZ18]
MPTTTTIEMKCGRYVAVCVNRLRRGPTIWFTVSASRIGATNPTTRVVRLIATVLRIRVQNSGLSKNCVKYFRPTHSPPVRPAAKSNSRNASWIPYIGTYANTTVTTIAGASMTHSCHFVRRCPERTRPRPVRIAGRTGVVPGTRAAVSSTLTATTPPPSSSPDPRRRGSRPVPGGRGGGRLPATTPAPG